MPTPITRSVMTTLAVLSLRWTAVLLRPLAEVFLGPWGAVGVHFPGIDDGAGDAADLLAHRRVLPDRGLDGLGRLIDLGRGGLHLDQRTDQRAHVGERTCLRQHLPDA